MFFLCEFVASKLLTYILKTVTIFRQFLTDKYLFNCTVYLCYLTENVKLVYWPLMVGCARFNVPLHTF